MATAAERVRALVVAALPVETIAIRRRLERRWRRAPGPAESRWRVEVTHCGVGPGRAAAMVDELRHRFPRLDLVLVVGVAGGLSPDLQPGELVEPDRVVAATGDEHRPAGAPAGGGVLLTVASPLLDGTAKRRAWERLGRPPRAVVDMETHVLLAGLPAGVEVRCARVVIDDASEALPEFLPSLLDSAGKVRFPRLIRELMARPAALPVLLRMAGRQRRAGMALADWVEQRLAARPGSSL